ncbi:hypothetical protein ALC62_01954 [Cyphomyrmex costatus]|uniref:Uncharacterized protein n=1 Tax=Cyphomyrmex costatus TaxID=456900 RepID=A0A151INN3_9HYME|nr:hypothetical protein ALC62_01954 [Cyphomyrmex costatus]
MGGGEGKGDGERSVEERSICSGMHSVLIALSASRIYTLLRAEPLKKPSFTLPPLHEASLSRALCHPIVKSYNFEARCALPVAKMDGHLTLDILRGTMENMSAKTSRRIRRYIGGDGGRQREERQDKGTTKGNPVAYKGG